MRGVPIENRDEGDYIPEESREKLSIKEEDFVDFFPSKRWIS